MFTAAIMALAAIVALKFPAGALSRRTAISDTEHWIDRLGGTYLKIESNEWGLRRGPDPEQPRAMLRSIGPGGVPICIEVLKSNASYRRRIGAIDALSVYGPAATPAIPLLITEIERVPETAEDEWQRPQIRDVAIRTILQTGPGIARASEQLAMSMRQSERGIDRSLVWTAYASASIEAWNREAVEILIRATAHADDAVHHDAIFALNRLSYRAALLSADSPIAQEVAGALQAVIEGQRDTAARGVALLALERMHARRRGPDSTKSGSDR